MSAQHAAQGDQQNQKIDSNSGKIFWKKVINQIFTEKHTEWNWVNGFSSMSFSKNLEQAAFLPVKRKLLFQFTLTAFPRQAGSSS